MPGREDFAIIRAGLLTDARAHAAADAYARDGLATEHTALAAVVGHVAMLALWASRDTDDGVLPGDGLIAASAALLCPRETAKRVVEALTTAGQLRKSRRGLYLVGFRGCYQSIFDKREIDRERKKQTRKSKRDKELAEIRAKSELSSGRPSDVQRTSERTGPDRTEPYRTVPDPTEPEPISDDTAGDSASPPPSNGTANGHGSVTPSERAGVLAACSAILGKRDVDRDIRAKAKAIQAALLSIDPGATDPHEVAEFVRIVVYSRIEARVAYLSARQVTA